MDPGSYLGLRLKDDAVLDYLESRDLSVRYEIDTLHENTPDGYWIEDRAGGLCLHANQHQRIETIFVYLAAAEAYEPYAGSLPWPIVKGAVPSLGTPARTGTHEKSRWVRYDLPDRSVHLTCHGTVPTLLTLMTAAATPGREVQSESTDPLTRITRDPTVMRGASCIRGMRLRVSDVLARLGAGETEESIRAEWPELAPEDFLAVYLYARQAVDQVP